jgi:hypothetical protein
MQALTLCGAKVVSTRTAVGQFKGKFKGEFKGAMEEMSQKVQNSSTHILRRKNHEHVHSSRSVQGSVQGGDGCKFRAVQDASTPDQLCCHGCCSLQSELLR